MLQNQRKLCGANSAAIDLLPPPGPGAEWTKDLPIDQGREADQVCLFFCPISSAPNVNVPSKPPLALALYLLKGLIRLLLSEARNGPHHRILFKFIAINWRFHFSFVSQTHRVSRFTCLMDQQASRSRRKWCPITWRRTSHCHTGWNTNTTPARANTSKSTSSATLMTIVSTSTFYVFFFFSFFFFFFF